MAEAWTTVTHWLEIPTVPLDGRPEGVEVAITTDLAGNSFNFRAFRPVLYDRKATPLRTSFNPPCLITLSERLDLQPGWRPSNR